MIRGSSGTSTMHTTVPYRIAWVGPVKINICEQKVHVNVTMHGGRVHRSKFAAMVPRTHQTHTTTTLTSARHTAWLDMSQNFRTRRQSRLL